MNLLNLLLLPITMTAVIILVIVGEEAIINTINAVFLIGVTRALVIVALPGALLLEFLLAQ